MYNEIPCLKNNSDLILHSHGYRQFGFAQLLSQVVDLKSLVMVANMGDGSGSYKIKSHLILF
jgi:hypothetical protein